MTAAAAVLPMAFSAALAEAAEGERRRCRLEVEAAETGARAQVESVRLLAEDERGATDALRIEVDEKNVEIAALKATAATQEATAIDLAARHAQTAAALETEQTARRDMEGRLVQATEAATVLREAAQRTDATIAITLAEAERLRSQVAVMEGKLATSQSVATELRASLVGAQAAGEAARADADRLRSQLDAKRDKLAAAVSQGADLRIAIAVAETGAAAKRQRAERVEADVSRAWDERSAAEVAARDASAAAAKARAEAEASRTHVEKLEAEVAALRKPAVPVQSKAA